MKSIAVIGEPEFTLGFRLAGIRDVFKPHEITNVLEREDLGIVVIDEQTMNDLDSRVREDVINSLNPVFVPLGMEANQEQLRKMIIQSIGVDILKDN